MKHYLEFTDGICIEAYLKSELPEQLNRDDISLDTSGEFLQWGNKPRRHKRSEACTDEEELNLFLRNAHRLIAEADSIMADSRMFLAPLPIRNGLAYTGTSGFSHPTLGIYIEWWRNNECAWTEDKSGTLQPIYHISGSPLSGCNACEYISAEGKSESVSVHHFSSVWRSFAKINTHYTEAKQLYEAYTLEEVIDKLFATHSNNA